MFPLSDQYRIKVLISQITSAIKEIRNNPLEGKSRLVVLYQELQQAISDNPALKEYFYFDLQEIHNYLNFAGNFLNS